ncbi:hypothetical protein MMC18_003633 [Xylographa bjoerkii]|nr:hypothetical protein [Xylographa bjoerkii]
MEFIKAQRTKIPHISPLNLASRTSGIGDVFLTKPTFGHVMGAARDLSLVLKFTAEMLTSSPFHSTGSNAGLGLEAAREFLASKPKRLILAVRNMEKGNAARQQLISLKELPTDIEVRKLDQGSFESVRDFVKGLNGERIDIAIFNAGVWNAKWKNTTDGLESDLQVNVLAPALLSLLLIPNARRATTAVPESPAHLTFVSSGLHEMAKFPERHQSPGHILTALNDPSEYNQQDRYATGKTIGLLWTRELAARLSSNEVVVNAVNPGFCKTGIIQNMSGMMAGMVKLTELLLGRSAADGARCIVDATLMKGVESHGKYLSEMQVKPESPLVRSDEGRELQSKIWDEIVTLLKEKGGLVQSAIP